MLIYEVSKPIELDELENSLVSAFNSILAALRAGESVVIAVDDRDIQGTGEPADAALAHGLLGICRALAIEGKKEDWSVAMLSSTPEVVPKDRARWIAELATHGATSGALMRLGGEYLGRLPT